MAGRKGRRSEEPSYRELQAGRLAEEKEREKTLIRVNEFVSVSELAAAMKVPATQIVQFTGYELPFEEMLEAYYQARGWDPVTGRPSPEVIERLDLRDVAQRSGRLAASPIRVLP